MISTIRRAIVGAMLVCLAVVHPGPQPDDNKAQSAEAGTVTTIAVAPGPQPDDNKAQSAEAGTVTTIAVARTGPRFV